MSTIVLIMAITFFAGYLVGNLMHSVSMVSHRRAKRVLVRPAGNQVSPN